MDFFFCFHCIYSTFGKAHRIAIYSKHGPTMCASAVRQREWEREFCVRKLQNKPNMKWRLIARKISYKLNLCNFHLFSKVSKSFAHHSSETKPLQNYFRIIFSSHLRMHAGEPSRMKFSEFSSEIWGGKEKSVLIASRACTFLVQSQFCTPSTWPMVCIAPTTMMTRWIKAWCEVGWNGRRENQI